MSSDLFSDGFFQDVVGLVNASMTGTCNIFSATTIENSQGEIEGFADPFSSPCRVDDVVDFLMPEREKDDLDVEKVERTIYLPLGTIIKIKDEIETADGNPTGEIVRYIVIDLTLETDQTDIGCLVEAK